MFKKIVLALLVIAVLFTAGCLGNTNTGGNSQNLKEVYNLGEKVKSSNMEFTVSDYSIGPHFSGSYVYVKVMAKNMGDNSRYVPSNIKLLVNGNQYEKDLSFTGTQTMDEYDYNKNILSGVKEEGWIRFELEETSEEDINIEDVRVAVNLSEYFGEKFVKWKLVEK